MNYLIDTHVRIGPYIAPDPDALEDGPRHGAFALREGTVDDGIGKEVLIDYLERDVTFRQYSQMYRFLPTPPEIVLAKGTEDHFVEEVVFMVQVMNSALPADWQLTIAPEPTETEDTEPESGQIVVRFAPGEDIPYHTLVAGLYVPIQSAAGTVETDDPRFEQGFGSYAEGGTAWINQERNRPKIGRARAIAHELIHGLGRRHTEPDWTEPTVMSNHTAVGVRPLHEGLPPLDNEALLAVYSVWELGPPPQYIAEDLGDWMSESRHLMGDVATHDGDVEFGVAWRNGLARPWASGPKPWTDLADNTALSGTVAWAGRVIGITPDNEAVTGAAALDVELETLAGTADFTSLEQWSTGTPLGDIGTGSTWNDGDLHYTLAVTGNTFHQTGGDAGHVAGAFFEREHAAAAGTVRRAALAAGFAGTR